MDSLTPGSGLERAAEANGLLVVRLLAGGAGAGPASRGDGKPDSKKLDLTLCPLLSVTVFDTGPGVGSEQKSRLFQYGASTKGVGRGHGLALIQEILTVSGGIVCISKEACSV